MTAKKHWLVAKIDRIEAAIKENPPCCATMGFNISLAEKVPDHIGTKCPWCNANVRRRKI